MREVVLREVEKEDLQVFFEQQADPDALRMAAFQPRERDAFLSHWTDILRHADVVNRTVLWGGAVAGYVACFKQNERRMIGYWFGKQYWGKGIATHALSEFLGKVSERPLYAYVAAHNFASLRVLEKCGFVVIERGNGPLDPAGESVNELLMVLARAKA